MSRQAALALEDGGVFVGQAFGKQTDAEGEVVFNTGMTGYQEVCTDPSYRGQLVVMTHPQIGNYGVSREAAESTQPWVAALIVRELAQRPHHWQASESLEIYLERSGVPGCQGIDTRALTRRLHARGTLRGVLRLASDGGFTAGELAALVDQARQVPELSERSVVSEVSGAGQSGLAGARGTPQGDLRIVVVDFGVKHNILRSLARRGVELAVVQHDAGADAVLSSQPDGVVLSNGPGDPASLTGAVAEVRRLLDERLPLMGICLGHQLLALAAGATTSRLRYGHHGGNHPVKDLSTGQVFITTQNHEFQVKPGSLPADSGFEVSHVNLNDGSVEGLAHRSLPMFSVQFHPEGCPGPQDNQLLFDRFLEIVARHRSAEGRRGDAGTGGRGDAGLGTEP